MLLLIERLSVGAMSEQIISQDNVLALRVGDNLVSRTLYAMLEQDNLYLLLLTSCSEKRSASQLASDAKEIRRESTKLKPVCLLELKEILLGSHDVMLCYQEAMLESSLQQLMGEVNRRTGFTRKEIAEKINVGVATVGRLEKNPLSLSLKHLVHYMAVGGAKLEITIKWPED